MKTFFKRAFTGVAIVVVITGLIASGPYGFMLLGLTINYLGLSEFYHLFRVDTHPVRKILGMVLSTCLLLTVCLLIERDLDSRILLINLVLVSVIFVAELYMRSDQPFADLGYLFGGIIYLTLPLALLFRCGFDFAERQYHPDFIFGYFLLLWANDTGAYLIGSWIGKRPLFKRISPNKTWEGSFGGALLVIMVAFLNHLMFGHISLPGWFTIGVVVIVLGTIGDLVKSMMKRSLHIKDSGTLLPGHGGILDRFDSLIGSVPIVFAFLTFAEQS